MEDAEKLSAASSALSEALSFAVPSVQSLSSAIDAAEGALSACDAAADALMRSEKPHGALVDAVATIALAVEASASVADALSLNESALAALHDDLRAMLYRVLLAATRGLWALTRDGRPQAPSTTSPRADVPSRAVETALRIALRVIDAEHDEGSRDSHEPTASLDVRDAAAAMSLRVLAAAACECSDPAALLLDAWKAVLAHELRMAQLAISALQGTDPMPSSQYASAIGRHEAAIRHHERLLRAASAGEVGVLASRLLRGAEARVAVRLRRAREGQQVHSQQVHSQHAERMVAAVLELLCTLCFAAAATATAAAAAAAAPEAAVLGARHAAMVHAQHDAMGRGPRPHAPRRALAPCWASLVARVYLMSAASGTSASPEEEQRLLRVQATNALGVLLGCTLPAECELATATALLDEHLPAPEAPNTAPADPEDETWRARECIERALVLALRRVRTPTHAREILARGAATWLLALHESRAVPGDARAVPGGPLAVLRAVPGDAVVRAVPGGPLAAGPLVSSLATPSAVPGDARAVPGGPLVSSMATPIDLGDTESDESGALGVLSSLCSAAGAAGLPALSRADLRRLVKHAFETQLRPQSASLRGDRAVRTCRGCLQALCGAAEVEAGAVVGAREDASEGQGAKGSAIHQTASTIRPASTERHGRHGGRHPRATREWTLGAVVGAIEVLVATARVVVPAVDAPAVNAPAVNAPDGADGAADEMAPKTVPASSPHVNELQVVAEELASSIAILERREAVAGLRLNEEAELAKAKRRLVEVREEAARVMHEEVQDSLRMSTWAMSSLTSLTELAATTTSVREAIVHAGGLEATCELLEYAAVLDAVAGAMGFDGAPHGALPKKGYTSAPVTSAAAGANSQQAPRGGGFGGKGMPLTKGGAGALEAMTIDATPTAFSAASTTSAFSAMAAVTIAELPPSAATAAATAAARRGQLAPLPPALLAHASSLLVALTFADGAEAAGRRVERRPLDAVTAAGGEGMGPVTKLGGVGHVAATKLGGVGHVAATKLGGVGHVAVTKLGGVGHVAASGGGAPPSFVTGAPLLLRLCSAVAGGLRSRSDGATAGSDGVTPGSNGATAGSGDVTSGSVGAADADAGPGAQQPADERPSDAKSAAPGAAPGSSDSSDSSKHGDGSSGSSDSSAHAGAASRSTPPLLRIADLVIADLAIASASLFAARQGNRVPACPAPAACTMALRTLLRTPANGEALAAALERAATRALPTDMASVADAVDALAALLAAGVEGPAGTAVPHLQLMLATALERAMRSAEAAHHLRGSSSPSAPIHILPAALSLMVDESHAHLSAGVVLLERLCATRAGRGALVAHGHVVAHLAQLLAHDASAVLGAVLRALLALAADASTWRALATTPEVMQALLDLVDCERTANPQAPAVASAEGSHLGKALQVLRTLASRDPGLYATLDEHPAVADLGLSKSWRSSGGFTKGSSPLLEVP